MHARLVVIGGKASRSQVSINLPTVIGRSREADLTVAHPMVSRRHCELYEVNGLVMIRDLDSLNGLFVGGTRVREAPLYPNAEFSVGPLTFRVEYHYGGGKAAAPDASTVGETPGPCDSPAVDPEDFRVVQELGTSAAAPMTAEPSDPQKAETLTPPAPLCRVSAAGDSGLAKSAGDHPSAEPNSAGVPSSIAPADGQLPDLAAWDAAAGGLPEPDRASAPMPPPRSAPGPGSVACPASASPPDETCGESPPEGGGRSAFGKHRPGVEESDEGGGFELSLPAEPASPTPAQTAPSEEDELDRFLKGLD